MIPDFKTYINESIWSDMEDRGTGEIQKNEDNLELLDLAGLLDWFKSHYENIWWPQEVYNENGEWQKMDIFLYKVTVPKCGFSYPAFVVYSVNYGERLDFRFHIRYCEETMPLLDFMKKCNLFNMRHTDSKHPNQEIVGQTAEYFITPKGTPSVEVTNTFIIETVKYVLEHFKKPNNFECMMKEIK